MTNDQFIGLYALALFAPIGLCVVAMFLKKDQEEQRLQIQLGPISIDWRLKGRKPPQRKPPANKREPDDPQAPVQLPLPTTPQDEDKE